MVLKQPGFCTVRGFAILSMTLILVFITISSSLAFASIQQQRIQRNQLNLNYLKAKITAANQLDLFYIVLYESPELLSVLPTCTNLVLDNQQRVTPNAMMLQYQLSEVFYLCVEKEAVFNITIAITYNDTEQLIMQRQIMTTSLPWTWQPISLYSF